MREILFRGKRIDNGEWVYGDLIQLHNQRNFIINNKFGACIDDKGNFINTESPFVCEVIPETIGQHTGLTANGTKIFEGDILRYGFIYDYNCYLESLEHPEEYDNEVYDQDIEVSAVEWCSDCDYPAFDLADHNFECNGLSQIMCGDYECEIIGNITDNPELLKERDNDE